MPDIVFQVVDSLSTGGAERMAVETSNGLLRRGWGVHLFATRALGPLVDDVADGISVHDLARRGRWDRRGLTQFRQALRRHSPTIVHAHGWSSLQFVTAALLGARRAPAVVFHDHLPRSAATPRPSFGLRAAAWASTSAHVAVDRAQLEPSLRTRHRAIRAVVPNGIPLDAFTVKVDHCMPPAPRLVALANLRPAKDHPMLFRALGSLVASGVDVRLDLVGTGADGQYRQHCLDELRRLDLGERVRLLGARTAVPSLLSDYDIGVLSSRAESGPLALIEYLAAGLPFVVTDVGDVPRTLPADLRSWVVPTDDHETLAERLLELLQMPSSERTRLAALGRAHVDAHHSIERTVGDLEEIYRQVMHP